MDDGVGIAGVCLVLTFYVFTPYFLYLIDAGVIDVGFHVRLNVGSLCVSVCEFFRDHFE